MKYLLKFEAIDHSGSISSLPGSMVSRSISQLKAEDGDIVIPYTELSKNIDDCFMDMVDDGWKVGHVRNPREIYEPDRHRMKIVIHKPHGDDESFGGKEYMNIINSVERCYHRYVKFHQDILEFDGIYFKSERLDTTYQVIDIWFSKKIPFVISEVRKAV